MNALARLVRDAVAAFDQKAGTSVKPVLGDVYRLARKLWSPVRRAIDPIRVRARYLVGRPPAVKLHLGCGPKHFDGYVNVDLWITDATDLVCDVRRLPWPSNSVALIESHHTIEHISHRTIEENLREWHRVLIPGGKLILETPNFDETVREYLSGNEERLLSIFGRQRRNGDAHLYGYNPERLARLLERVGFRDFQQRPPQSHQSEEEPVFRLECVKKSSP